ncbi:MAG: TonB-dependent receptor [Bacteroidales bacterium]|nr:TonB-dependent receptor [Bacteroidales bacterium]
MKHHLLLLVLLALGCFLPLSAVAQHTISGTVTDAQTGETLIGATVYDTVSRKGTTTNQHGRYSLTLKNENAVVRVSFVGCETQFFALTLKADHRMDVQLKSSYTLREVVIKGERIQHLESSQPSVVEVPVEQVKAIPMLFGETDVVKAVQLLPGVQNGSEGTAGMYVRGGGPDENLFLLDGVPMYNVNHLGGFFSAFNSDAVKNINLYKGSFPARFGSRLSSVLDITTNNGNDKEYHGGVGIGLISAKVNVEGPIIKEKTTFSFSGRRTYGDILLQPLLANIAAAEGSNSKINAGYYFYDLNAKVTHRFSDRSRLYASYYMGDDALYARIKVMDGYDFQEYMKLSYRWGNIVGSVRWNYELTPKLFLNLSGAYTRYRSKLSIGMDYEDKQDQLTESLEAGFRSGIRDYLACADFDWAPAPDHSAKFGTHYTFHYFTPETQSVHMKENEETFDTVIGQNTVGAHEIMLYAEDDWRINDIFKVNLGLNVTGFSVQGKFYPSLQPRVSGRWLVNDRLSVKAGYARMTQYLHLLSTSTISLPTDLWVPVTAHITPMTSNQVALGVFYNLMDSLNLSVEGYYKNMDNLLEYKDGASFWGSSAGWEQKVCMGRGWAYGIEFLAQKTIGKWTGWVGYTWSHTDRVFDRPGMTLNDGKPFPAKYDRRHDISLVLTYKFNERFDASLTWVYATGNAATLALQQFDPEVEPAEESEYYYTYQTSADYVSSRNNYRMPAYHRMDISLNWHKDLRFGKGTINVSVYNLYNRQNPYMLYTETTYSGNRSLNQLSLFPFLPSVSYIWTF